jgi:hypothetical protein
LLEFLQGPVLVKLMLYGLLGSSPTFTAILAVSDVGETVDDSQAREARKLKAEGGSSLSDQEPRERKGNGS